MIAYLVTLFFGEALLDVFYPLPKTDQATVSDERAPARLRLLGASTTEPAGTAGQQYPPPPGPRRLALDTGHPFLEDYPPPFLGHAPSAPATPPRAGADGGEVRSRRTIRVGFIAGRRLRYQRLTDEARR